MYEGVASTNASDRTATNIPGMKKQNSAMQADWPGLAALNCNYDPQTDIFTVKRKGVRLLVAQMSTPAGRKAIGTFFTGDLAAIHPNQAANTPIAPPCS